LSDGSFAVDWQITEGVMIGTIRRAILLQHATSRAAQDEPAARTFHHETLFNVFDKKAALEVTLSSEMEAPQF
jgi:hypothetical protein